MRAFEVLFFSGLILSSVVFSKMDTNMTTDGYTRTLDMWVKLLLPLSIFAFFIASGLYFSYQALERKEDFKFIYQSTGYLSLREDVNSWHDPNWDRNALICWNPNLLGLSMGYSLK